MLSPHKDGNAERGTASLLRRYDDVTLGGGSHGLFERRIAVAAGRAAADHSADRFVLAPLGATRQKGPASGPFRCRNQPKWPGTVCAPQSTTCRQNCGDREPPIAHDSTNRLDRFRGWEAESRMRVASLESVLAVATLVSAAVVVLWGFKILYGM